jgi:CRP-like cAMP-binding protein
MFAIFSGEVAIYDGPKHLATFSNNDIFGELALLDTEARSGTAVALSDLRLLKIAQADFYDLMEDRSEVLRSIIRILCQRLRAQNQN